MPDVPNVDNYGPHGWIAAAAVMVLGAVATLWTAVRKGRSEDSTTALTHANAIIRGQQQYATRLETRVAALEKKQEDADTLHRKQVEALWEANGDTERKERRCQLRLEWLCGHLRSNDIDIPPWPFAEDDGDGDPHSGSAAR